MDTTAVYQKCISPGSWRMRSACQPLSSSSTASGSLAKRQCAICLMDREASHFEDDSVICSSCTVLSKSEVDQCTVCSQSCRQTATCQDESLCGHFFCLQCAPKAMPLRCTVCEEERIPGAFEARYRTRSTDPHFIRRCKACSEPKTKQKSPESHKPPENITQKVKMTPRGP